MGQSINVLLYGCRVPAGIDLEALIEKWEDHVANRVKAFEARLRAKTNSSWGLARDAYVPSTPNPDDAEPDDLVGFYVCRGYHDHAESHTLPAMTLAEMRTDKRTAPLLRRRRRRWSRFARWARTQGVEFGKPRIWRTRAEVA
jgi:hypothetical protein